MDLIIIEICGHNKEKCFYSFFSIQRLRLGGLEVGIALYVNKEGTIPLFLSNIDTEAFYVFN